MEYIIYIKLAFVGNNFHTIFSSDGQFYRLYT